MNNQTGQKRRKIIILLALVAIIILALILYSICFPLHFQKFTSGLSGEFDRTRDFVKFLDVGQGDSILIYSNGYSAVIDVGMPDFSGDVGLALSDCDIDSIDTMLISHLHADHVGALPNIAKEIPIENLIMPEILKKSTLSAKNGKLTACQNGSEFLAAKQGMHFDIGEFEITLLYVGTDKTNENNRSVFAMAEIDGIKFLFTGDAERKEENLLLRERLDIDCDVLKVSHHGSDTSTSPKFLKATTPEYAVVSVGEENSYGHPSSKTLSALENAGAEIFRTDQSGDITFDVNNGKIAVTKEK